MMLMPIKRLSQVLLVVLLVAPVLAAPQGSLGFGQSSSVDIQKRCHTEIVTVFTNVCCPDGSNYTCCCTDCIGRYHYKWCDGVLVEIGVFCCKL